MLDAAVGSYNQLQSAFARASQTFFFFSAHIRLECFTTRLHDSRVPLQLLSPSCRLANFHDTTSSKCYLNERNYVLNIVSYRTLKRWNACSASFSKPCAKKMKPRLVLSNDSSSFTPILRGNQCPFRDLHFFLPGREKRQQPHRRKESNERLILLIRTHY